MGEAKRRKQLGLMPTVHPFEARLTDEGQVTLITAGFPANWQDKTQRALQKHVNEQYDWPRRYRRQYVMAGLPQRRLRSAADVEAIEVPRYRRLIGELLLNYDPRKNASDLTSTLKVSLDYLAVPENDDPTAVTAQEIKTWAHVKEEHSFDGRQWQSFPEPKHAFEGFRNLMQHPVTEVEGELVGRYQIEVRPGEPVIFEPEPPAEHQQQLQELLSDWFGATPEKWAEHFHEAQQTPTALEPFTPLPTRIRGVVELRHPAPLPGLGNMAMANVGPFDVMIPFEERTYSTQEGNEGPWLAYERDQPEPQDDLEIMVPVTVWADGTLDLSDPDLTAPQQNMLRAILPDWMGTGTPETWEQRTRELLLDALEEQPLQENPVLPVPKAVKLSIFEGLWWEDETKRPLNIVLAEVNFDGEHWHDLYDDELPTELQPFLVPPAQEG